MDVHVCQHVPHEGPGAIADWADARGHDLRIVRLDRGEELPDPDDVSLLVVMGGPMGVYDTDEFPFLAEERGLIRTVHEEAPVLGVCLGAQQLAAALGAPVGPHGDAEIGWFPVEATEDGVAPESPLAALGETYEPLHWHGDSFALPDDATLLATSEACHTQAFAVDGSLGLQYHLEVTPSDVARFLEASDDLPEGPWIQSPGRIRAGGAYERLHEGLFDALDWLVGDS